MQFANETIYISEKHEENATWKIPVSRIGREKFSGEISVDYKSIGGSALSGVDFVGVADTLTFPAGIELNEFSFNVTVNHDNIYEYPDEKFEVQLFNVRYDGLPLGDLGKVNTTTLVIEDDGDSGIIQFSSENYPVVEQNTSNLRIWCIPTFEDVRFQ